MSDSTKREEAKRRQRERVENLAAVLADARGRQTMADILISLGMGSAISESGIESHNQALKIFYDIRQADFAAATEILKIIYGLNI